MNQEEEFVEVYDEEDVMAGYKSRRFAIADDDLGFGSRLVVLTDLGFWVKNQERLQDWCQMHGATQKGMTVELPSDNTLTLFVLQWS